MSREDKFFESLRQGLKGKYEVREVMAKFSKINSDHIRKERFVNYFVENGRFDDCPPEQWADLAKYLYLQYTALTN